MRHSALKILVVLGFLWCAGCNAPTPIAARYLSGAEIQAETDEQRSEIRAALADLAAGPPVELRAKRYGPGRVTLPVFLRAHILPAKPTPVEDDDFYAQAADPRVRLAAEELRGKIKESNNVEVPGSPKPR